MSIFRRRSTSPKPCVRCSELRAAPPESLLFFFNPGTPVDTERDRREGERVRTLALAMHAAEGHPE